MSLEIQSDARGNQYIEVGRVRISFVEKRDGWAGPDFRYYLRIQAYREDPANSHALNQGPELPLRDCAEACEFAAGLSDLLSQSFRNIAPPVL